MAGEPHGPFRNLILRYLFGLAPVKDIDLHLTVGEALALIGAATPAGGGAPTADASAAASTAVAALPPLPPVVPPRKTGVDTGVASGSAVAKAAKAAAEAAKVANGGGSLMAYILRKVGLPAALTTA